jgi:hypothetical protein
MPKIYIAASSMVQLTKKLVLVYKSEMIDTRWSARRRGKRAWNVVEMTGSHHAYSEDDEVFLHTFCIESFQCI